jgi:hypothetical protein
LLYPYKRTNADAAAQSSTRTFSRSLNSEKKRGMKRVKGTSVLVLLLSQLLEPHVKRKFSALVSHVKT